MVLNTITAAVAITPTVIETIFSHYLHRGPLHQKPTAHLSYHAGLQLIRRFLALASKHTVDDVQAFTSQWVPTPHWVRVEDVKISEAHIEAAVEFLTAQLGPEGINVVGGGAWWQWRLEEVPLRADWIEMRRDYEERKRSGGDCKRCMLYVHGGAYYFGSVDEHRYQIQRHARKLQARVLAPRYRLAPQFPFPCGLLDCLAAYLFLLTVQAPETIILAGDSAGGGMIISILVLLRDQGLPLPAGAVLISPWSDLTHSFPSVAGWNELDYVPPHGFVHKPSPAWPPPNSDDLKVMEEGRLQSEDKLRMRTGLRRGQSDGFEMHSLNGRNEAGSLSSNQPATDDPSSDSHGISSHPENLSIRIDDQVIEIKDQIQIYTTNSLISHPLVSPVLQPSLGGLPPLLVLVGGGEMLRDEQIYLAHKAAAPAKYPSRLASHSPAKPEVQWPATNVQLQVWDDLCHVAPTLSFSRPAKYMYRSVAQFGAWALARAQQSDITIPEDYASDISSDTSSTSSREATSEQASHGDLASTMILSINRSNSTAASSVGKAGSPLPLFVDHMIRQRVDRHGLLFPLAPASTLAGCTMSPEEIGVIKSGPVRKWMTIQQEWSDRYSKQKRKIQKQRLEEMKGSDYGRFGDDTPPPTALVGRRGIGRTVIQEQMMKKRKSKGLAVWANWASKHDEQMLEKEAEKYNVDIDKNTEVPAELAPVVASREARLSEVLQSGLRKERSASHSKVVKDEGQIQSWLASARQDGDSRARPNTLPPPEQRQQYASYAEPAGPTTVITPDTLQTQFTSP